MAFNLSCVLCPVFCVLCSVFLDNQLTARESRSILPLMSRSCLKTVIFLCCFCLLAAGCSMKYLVIKATSTLVDETILSFYAETDIELAGQAAPANLKLVEGMARGAPDNQHVQAVAAQLLGIYTFGFIEDSVLDEDEQEELNERAKVLYMRGKGYGLRGLQERIDFERLCGQNIDDFKEGLKHYGKKQVPLLFWTAFNWGLYINLSRDNISAVADRGKVTAMMERVAELDEGYFYGGAHMFLMVNNALLGRALGGDPEKAKAEYEKAWALSGGKFLVTKYLFAKYYCQQTLDEELFDKLVAEIAAAPEDLLPEQALANALAKQKAVRLSKLKEELF